jgi:sugar phosphate isomerase/epimerase
LRRFGIVEFSTLHASFEDDLMAYAAAGVDGIGICEHKLVEGREREQLEAVRASGLAVGSAIPAVPSVLPLPLFPGPEDPAERVEAIVAGMRRLALFEPQGFVCFTGPEGERTPAEARRIVAEGLRAIEDESAGLGVPVGVEPMSAHTRSEWTIVTSLDETAELLEETGTELGITFDTWHLWDTPGLQDELARHGDRIVNVHVNDRRPEASGWSDRVLPGEGIIDLQAVLGALEAAGWDGLYELEVFSDDGTFGNHYEDSLWQLAPVELARRARESFSAALDGSAEKQVQPAFAVGQNGSTTKEEAHE